MVHYNAYCSKCDKITGHTITGMDSACDKCGFVGKRKAPYLSWLVLGVLIIGLAATSIYIIYQSALILGSVFGFLH